MAEALWQGWETVGLIGKGGFGSVYEIRRTILDETEKAALKVITIPQSNNEVEELYSDGYTQQSVSEFYAQHLRAILSEYTTMRKLSSCDNVVKCQDVRYEQHPDGIGWDIYIKMELLTPLNKAFPQCMSEKLVIKLAKDMCRALQMCRKQGVLHRDIKPQNIFISEEGQFKLGDFGIAKAVEKTTGGTKIGTYKYMAPEVFNNQPYGAGADIYSLGLVLYWLLNEHRVPFLPLPPATPGYSHEEQAKLRRFRGEPIPAPKNGSAALKAVVLKACAFRPQDRFSSADEMLAALEDVEKGPRPAPVLPVVPPEQSEEKTVCVRPSAVHQEETVRQTPPKSTPEPQTPKEIVPDFRVHELKQNSAHSLPVSQKKSRKAWLIPLVALLMIFAAIWIIRQNGMSNLPADEQEEVQRPQLDTSDLAVGDVIYFGMYERDNDTSNGQEQLSWKVLDIQDGKALVVSTYILGSRENWDSNKFLNAAFTVEEQSWIPTVPYSNTADKVFSLSTDQVETLFSDEYSRRCQATAYARANGVWDNGGYSWWLLWDSDALMGVSDNGDILTITGGAESVGVRPAMWINLD